MRVLLIRHCRRATKLLLLAFLALFLFLVWNSTHEQDSMWTPVAFWQRAALLQSSIFSWQIFQLEPKISRTEYDAILQSLPKLPSNFGICKAPKLPLYTKFILKHRPPKIPIDVCSRRQKNKNWLRVWQSRVYLREGVEKAACTAEPIVRVNDQSSKFGAPQPLLNGSEIPSLGFRANCKTPSGRRHSSVYFGIKRIPTPRRNRSFPAVARDNIVILGVDSVSRLESLRSLANASRLAKRQLDGVTLQQYNIMGDGTPASLTPFLTGTPEYAMPEARRGFKGARYLDEAMRWIFQDLRDLGYLSLYGEEGNSFGTFQYRFHGFRQEIADFYLRHVLSLQEAIQKHICIGDETSSSRKLRAIQELFTMYPNQPKFAFLFFADLSHEGQDLSVLDAEWTEFVNWFISESLIKNTSLILMSDHGQRLGPLRNSMQGRLEESLPLMTLALSSQLRKRMPNARQTLESNIQRLATPLDIHKTLLSIAGAPKRVGGSEKFPSYSLIEQSVPENRSCLEAGISTHWCSCLSGVRLSDPADRYLAVRAARFIVSQINLATNSFRHVCLPLYLSGIDEADVSLASSDLARRERHTGNGPFAYNTEIKGLQASGYVTVRFVTKPGLGRYEATAQFSLFSSMRLEWARVGEASRINRYGTQADCISRQIPSLRKFCYCRHQAGSGAS